MSNIQAERDCVSFLKRAGHWPNWPWCPVKNHRKEIKEQGGNDWGGPLCGLVFDEVPLSSGDQGQATPTVHILNMWQGWTKEEYANCKKFEYATIEDMVAAGWEVD